MNPFSLMSLFSSRDHCLKRQIFSRQELMLLSPLCISTHTLSTLSSQSIPPPHSIPPLHSIPLPMTPSPLHDSSSSTQNCGLLGESPWLPGNVTTKVAYLVISSSANTMILIRGKRSSAETCLRCKVLFSLHVSCYCNLSPLIPSSNKHWQGNNSQ